jgi:lipoprotein-anchoring transpeptidase ErfK/SrfK
MIVLFFITFLLSGCATQPELTPAPVVTPAPASAPPASASPSPAASPTLAPTPTPMPTSTPRAADSLPQSYQMDYEELVADNGDDYTPETFPPKDTYTVEVDVTNQVTSVYDAATGAIVRQMLCSSGKRATPSPLGKFNLASGRARFGRFEDYNCYAQYITQITGKIYFHSVLYNKRGASALVKSSYDNLGKRASHGCIRLTVPDAKWIYENIAPGTAVKFIEKPKDDELREKLALPRRG